MPRDPEKLELDRYSLSATRLKIAERLAQRPWFQRTERAIQEELINLPQEGRENHDGFLGDLADRPDQIGGREVVRLEKLARGNVALIPVFEVRVVGSESESYSYEYVSWRYGPKSGNKGVVFVKQGEQVTHFVFLRGEKFATGELEADTLGGFIDLDVDGVNTVLDQIRKELTEELRVDSIQLIGDPVNLNRLCTDSGMTNNTPSLFAVFVDSGEVGRFDSVPDDSHRKELSSRIEIVPIDKLREVVMEERDSLLISTVARAWANGLIPFK